MALEIKYTCVCHLLWHFYNHTFFLYMLLKLLCMVSNVLHSFPCLCVGVPHYKYGGQRENEHVKRMHCPSPFLFFIIIVIIIGSVLLHLAPLFSPQASLSVSPRLCVLIYTCISVVRPPYLCPISSPPVIYCHCEVGCH